MIVPAVAVSSVPRTCSSVDLPTPEAPTTDAISPGCSSKFMPRSTSMRLPLCANTLVRSRTLTAAPRRTPAAAWESAVGTVVMGCAKVVGAPGGVNDAEGPESPRLGRVSSGCLGLP